MSLSSLLPKPKASSITSKWDVESEEEEEELKLTKQSKRNTRKNKKSSGPPPYMKRSGFIPQSQEDFGDGGAFPEIHMVQFPLDMGLTRSYTGSDSVASLLPLQKDDSGKLRYDLVLHQGEKKNDRKIVHSNLDAMKQKDLVDGDESFLRPDEESINETTTKTREALEKLMNGKIASGRPKALNVRQDAAPTFVKYTPANQTSDSLTTSRIIKLVEAPVDPFEPPKFKHKKVPRGPPSPPPPVMHSPPRKVSVEEQKNWVIPPCISNWKNAKGYTIPLDKRMANDGRGLQEVAINDNFAKLSEALFIADRHAREEVKIRADLQTRLAEKEKREKEEKLRMLAQKAREERAGLVSGSGEAPSAERLIADVFNRKDDSGSEEEEENLNEAEKRELKERERIRRDKAKQREHELRLSHMGSETKARVLSTSEDRDISEKIALGLAKPSVSKDTMFDQRLFNQSAGISSGFGAEDSYSMYDKPLFQGSAANAVYRPKRADAEVAAGIHTDKIERLLGNSGGPSRGFQGADQTSESAIRDGPVAFEKEQSDIFGFQDFMSSAKRGRGNEQEDKDVSHVDKKTKE